MEYDWKGPISTILFIIGIEECHGWRMESKEEFVVQEVADGIFLFRFQCKRDFEYVDGNGPWHFNKHMLIL